MTRLKKKRSFNPDAVADSFVSAISFDLASTSVYQLANSSDPFNLYKSRQQHEVTKKLKTSNSSKNLGLRTVAIDGFLKTNERIGRVNREIDLPNVKPVHLLSKEGRSLKVWPRLPKEAPAIHKLLVKAKSFVAQVLGEITLSELFSQCKNSGGTTVGLSYANTAEIDKFTYPLTFSGSNDRLFELYLKYDPQLANAIEELNRFSVMPRYQQVDGSNTTTVDKDDTKDRTIAIEPTVDMFFQQGIMSCMVSRLKSVLGLDLARVPFLHHALARAGSCCPDLWATIDFREASSSVSKALFEFLFPPVWCSLISSVATKATYIKDKNEWYGLEMISTMGNATTFPVETLVFASLMYAVITETDDTTLLEVEKFKLCSVFGDDCIIRTCFAPRFIELAEHCGFEVNTEKSFIDPQSHFRESCGQDYLFGRNTRPFYIKAPTSNRRSALEPWMYIIFNQIQKKYIPYFGLNWYDTCPWTLAWFISMCKEYEILVKLVPPDFPDDSGLLLSDCNSDLVQRLANAGVKFSRLDRDRHGTISFSFCSFRFREGREFEPLRLWQGLRKPLPWRVDRINSEQARYFYLHRDKHQKFLGIDPEEPAKDMFLVKKKGGYVTQKGLAAWLERSPFSPKKD